MTQLYQVGDIVLLKDSCQSDIGTFAWTYIQTHRRAIVKTVQASQNGILYGLEWPEDFEGGHDCYRTVTAQRGQFVTEQHLELENFEASREVNTVPQFQGYDDDQDTISKI
jgi:hypothetical protein